MSADFELKYLRGDALNLDGPLLVSCAVPVDFIVLLAPRRLVIILSISCFFQEALFPACWRTRELFTCGARRGTASTWSSKSRVAWLNRTKPLGE